MSVEDPRETFERRLVREILGAERVRARLLFAIPTIALFALVVVGGAYPEAVASLLHGRIDTAPKFANDSDGGFGRVRTRVLQEKADLDGRAV